MNEYKSINGASPSDEFAFVSEVKQDIPVNHLFIVNTVCIS